MNEFSHRWVSDCARWANAAHDPPGLWGSKRIPAVAGAREEARCAAPR